MDTKDLNCTVKVPVGDGDAQTFLDHFSEAHQEALQALSLAAGVSIHEIGQAISVLNFDTEEATRVSAELYEKLKAITPAVLTEKEQQRQRSKADIDRKRRMQRGANLHHLGRQR